MKTERLEDHRARIPTPRMEEVHEDADRALAAPAEVTTDTDDEVDGYRDVAQDLSRVGAVADDADETAGSMRWTPAPGTRRGPEGVYGGKASLQTETVVQILDGVDDDGYDDHRIFGCGGDAHGQNTRVAAFLLPEFGYSRAILHRSGRRKLSR